MLFPMLAFSSAFSTPITATVLVKLDDAPAINQAVKTVLANVENILVVRYGSTEYVLTVWRAVGHIIWLGHGSEQGIRLMGSMVGWESFVINIKRTTPGRSILLSCFAVKALQYNDGGSDLITIGAGYIDAVLGGMLVSYILTGSASLISQTIHRVASLLRGDAVFLPLYWSTEEQIWAGIDFVIWLVCAITGLYSVIKAELQTAARAVRFAAGASLAMLAIGIAEAIIGFATGTMTATAAAMKIAMAIGQIFFAIFTKLPWWYQVLIGASVVISLTNPAKLVTIILAVASFLFWVWGVVRDMNDPDPYYGSLAWPF